MSDLRKAAQMALEALEADPYEIVEVEKDRWGYTREVAWRILRAALAQPIIPPEIKGNKTQPEQAPVAYQWLGTSVIRKRIPKTAEADAWAPLYTYPPHRKPLMEEEICKLFGYDNQYGVVPGYAMSFVRAVEKAHGIGGEHE
jgi:hypothetical protein